MVLWVTSDGISVTVCGGSGAGSRLAHLDEGFDVDCVGKGRLEVNPRTPRRPLLHKDAKLKKIDQPS